MRLRHWCLPPACLLAGWAQSDSPITREGTYWVQTITGSAQLQGSNSLRVSTRGAVTVQGEVRADIAYTLKKRVRASTQESARAALSGCVVKTSRQGPWGTLVVSFPSRRSELSAELRLSVPRTLREAEVESEGGGLEARDLEGGLKADTSGGAVLIDRIGGDLSVRTGGGEVRLGQIGRTVRCSSGGGSISVDSVGGEAGLNTGGGEIHIREARGPVRANTGGGNIRVDRGGGPVTASTGGGLIDVGQAEGPVAAETGAGSIKVRSAQGVRCESGAGAIQLLGAYGRLRAATGMGSILAELAAGKPLEDSVLSTASGDITVFIPSNLAVTIQALTDSPGFRRIISDFPEIRLEAGSRGARAEAQGSLNGGGPLLKLSVSEGTIYLRRQK
jgi:hypothetical protein